MFYFDGSFSEAFNSRKNIYQGRSKDILIL